MELIDQLKSAVLAALGIDYAGAPVIDRMALYRATVIAAAADGSTVDVKCDSKRLGLKGFMQRVPLRVGIPGAVAVVAPKAVVLIGWEGGNSSKAYAVPSWESGATVTKLVVNAQHVFVGAESGAQALVRKGDFDGHTHPLPIITAPNGSCTIGAPTPSPGDTGGAPAATGTAVLKAT